MATSRARVPRTSTMFATLAAREQQHERHGDASTPSAGRTGPKTTDMKRLDVRAARLVIVGIRLLGASVVAVISFCAASIDTGRDASPRTRIGCVLRGIAWGSSCSGTHASTRCERRDRQTRGCSRPPAATAARRHPDAVGKHADDERGRSSRRSVARSRPGRDGTRAPIADR